MNRKLTATLVMTLLATSYGCSSSNDDGDDGTDDVSGDIDLWGFVEVDQSSADDTVEMVAAFMRFSERVPARLVADSFRPTLDTCEVTTAPLGDSDDFEPPELDGVSASIEFVSAGEAITFQTPAAGTFAELGRQTLFGFTLYVSEVDPIDGPVPSGLTLDIPGDVFPAFADVPVTAVESFRLDSPTEQEAVTPSTTFTWNAGTGTGTHVEIDVQSDDIEADVGTNVLCIVRDDGSFVFPEGTRAEMGADFMSEPGVIVRRAATTFRQEGGALLIVDSGSSN